MSNELALASWRYCLIETGRSGRGRLRVLCRFAPRWEGVFSGGCATDPVARSRHPIRTSPLPPLAESCLYFRGVRVSWDDLSCFRAGHSAVVACCGHLTLVLVAFCECRAGACQNQNLKGHNRWSSTAPLSVLGWPRVTPFGRPLTG